ncbi:lipocalin family protein [Dubosiella newyorkensis]|uniref:lipocalin family protein n=1 Tax=Dubosiella newyorkensis TaxID=1862672 RepID=UPI0025748138|nr:lipocalin family protein [Dubosiella newyorkensis]
MKTNRLIAAFLVMNCCVLAGCASTSPKESEPVQKEEKKQEEKEDSKSENNEHSEEPSEEKGPIAVTETEQIEGAWEVVNIRNGSPRTFTFNGDGTYEDYTTIESELPSDNVRSGTYTINNGEIVLNLQSFVVGEKDLTSTAVDKNELIYKANINGDILELQELGSNGMIFVLQKVK